MSLKEFADYINENSELYNYQILNGVLELDNDIHDSSYIVVNGNWISVKDCYTQNETVISV